MFIESNGLFMEPNKLTKKIVCSYLFHFISYSLFLFVSFYFLSQIERCNRTQRPVLFVILTKTAKRGISTSGKIEELSKGHWG